MSTETMQIAVIITSIVAITIFAVIMHIRMERKYNREMEELYQEYFKTTKEINEIFNLDKFKDEEE